MRSLRRHLMSLQRARSEKPFMPDLLLVSSDEKTQSELVALATRQGFRVKIAKDPIESLEWACRQPFDVCLIDYSQPGKAFDKVTAKCWEFNKNCPFYTFNLGKPSGVSQSKIEYGLMGIECIEGLDIYQRIEELLCKLKETKFRAPNGFEILVVEDLDSPRDVICAFVEHVGYPRVTGVASAEAALRELETHPQKYACVLSDINMPEIDGKQLIATIRAHKKFNKIPVIVLTAYGTSDNLVECLQAGASGFLVKPPSKKDLNRELARAIRLFQTGANPRLVPEGETLELRKALIRRGELE